jgi:Flp pilus assembly protein TadG
VQQGGYAPPSVDRPEYLPILKLDFPCFFLKVPMRDVLARLLSPKSYSAVDAHRSPSPDDKRRERQMGGAVVEIALLMPWIVFLFVGILDVGFYGYAMIVTENAARVSAIQASVSTAASSDSLNACAVALQEMSSLPNTAGLLTCGSGTVSASAPVSVVATSLNHGSGDVSSKVTVMYLTLPLVAIPGILPQQMTLTRSAEVRVGS